MKIKSGQFKWEHGLETIFFNPAQYVDAYRHLGAAETKDSFAFRHSLNVNDISVSLEVVSEVNFLQMAIQKTLCNTIKKTLKNKRIEVAA